MKKINYLLAAFFLILWGCSKDTAPGVQNTSQNTTTNTPVDTAPCYSPNNTYYYDGIHYPFNHIYYGPAYSNIGNYGIIADSLNGGYLSSINFYFNGPPVTGVYISSSSVGGSSVVITIGWTRYRPPAPPLSEITPINSGDSIYVIRNSNGSTTISFCALICSDPTSPLVYGGKITY